MQIFLPLPLSASSGGDHPERQGGPEEGHGDDPLRAPAAVRRPVRIGKYWTIKSHVDVQVSAVALCLTSVTTFPLMRTLSRLTAGNCQSNDDKQLQGVGLQVV